jgi:hypothetical protein
MREILFKAWYKELGISNSFGLGSYPTWGDETLPYWDKKCKFMQFTGEKCFITGSDLYEGDIMERNLELFVIEFFHGGFVCRSLEKPNVLRSLSLLTSVTSIGDAGAKIGNIYKNPELLEKKLK